MAILWPAVCDWLITTLPALAGWSSVQVFDGQPVTGDSPLDYVTVGWVGEDSAGNWESLKAESGLHNEETGTVRCCLTCNTGDDVAVASAQVRTRLFDLLDTLDATLRADQTLGESLAANGLVELTAGQVIPVQDEQGTALQVVFAVSYTSASWRS